MTKRIPWLTPARSYPTMRQMLKGKNRSGRRNRAPWYAGFPNRDHASWAQTLRRK
ncbi:MAG: hypothetical protein SFU56_03610 [Capsulimonadales bacterium]|nr:hypothetical protein [Capsulimonadales bacterium]